MYSKGAFALFFKQKAVALRDSKIYDITICIARFSTCMSSRVRSNGFIRASRPNGLFFDVRLGNRFYSAPFHFQLHNVFFVVNAYSTTKKNLTYLSAMHLFRTGNSAKIAKFYCYGGIHGTQGDAHFYKNV